MDSAPHDAMVYNVALWLCISDGKNCDFGVNVVG